MNINIINPFQGAQNAVRPSGGKTSNASSGPVTFSAQNSGGVSSGEVDTVAGQSLGITAHISKLQGQLDNLNVIHDPPFFPIARYQRIDLITKIRRIQAEIGQSSLPPEVKQAVSTDKLKNNATDKQIGEAVGQLFAIRETLTQGRKIAVKHTQPGSILTLKA